MKKLSKTRLARRDELAAKLREAREKLTDAFSEAYNQGGSIRDTWDAYQALVEEATTFRDEVVSDMDSYASDRSEKWAEGDAGQAYEEWKSEWENVELDLGELDEPDYEDIVPDFAERLDELPEEPSS